MATMMKVSKKQLTKSLPQRTEGNRLARQSLIPLLVNRLCNIWGAVAEQCESFDKQCVFIEEGIITKIIHAKSNNSTSESME